MRAAKASGDQRINSFGIGGEIEVRAGLLTQKQSIGSQLVHFGLGHNSQVDVARITWPNGVVQGEFELKANREILATQRLKGSCPWLFAWDGKQMSFVKDGSPWSAALGLHINAQVVAGIQQTEEWFKIRARASSPATDSTIYASPTNSGRPTTSTTIRSWWSTTPRARKSSLTSGSLSPRLR
ncbi:MAG: ASPIC/UnbV domain-containing protein [Ignavibacteriota bacterium]